MRLQLVDLPRIGCPTSKQSRDLVNLLGLSPQQLEASAWSTTEIKRKKITGVSFVSLFFCLDFFSFFQFEIKKKQDC